MSSEKPWESSSSQNFIPVRKRVKIDYSKSFDYNQSVTKNPQKRFRDKRLKKRVRTKNLKTNGYSETQKHKLKIISSNRKISMKMHKLKIKIRYSKST
jgi:hypothetical protein